MCVEFLSIRWSDVSGRARAEQSGEGGQKGGGRGGDRRRTPGSKGVPSRLQQGYKKLSQAVPLLLLLFCFFFLIQLLLVLASLSASKRHSLHFISSLQSQDLGFLPR